MRRLITFLYLLTQRMAINQAKPQTWHAEGVRSAVLSSAFRLLRRIPIDSKISPESVSGGVNLYSVCVCESSDQLLKVSGMHFTTFSETAGGLRLTDRTQANENACLLSVI